MALESTSHWSRLGIPVSINKSKGSKIELDQLLLVFVNEILQKPGDSYNFAGGSQITFTEPLKIETLSISVSIREVEMH